MTVGEAIYQDILDNPDADDLRLIYSDWLADNGEEDRAEFIRLSVEEQFSQLSTQCHQPNRRDQLVINNYGKWWPDFDLVTQYDDFRNPASISRLVGLLYRGDIDTIRCTSGFWLEFRLDYLRKYPIRRVELIDKFPLSSVMPGTEVVWYLSGFASHCLCPKLIGFSPGGYLAHGYKVCKNLSAAKDYLSERALTHARNLLREEKNAALHKGSLGGVTG